MKYRKFVRILVFLFAIVLFDFILGSILEVMYFKQNRGLYYRTTYSIDSTNAEVLIFGASTANHHYVPEILEKKLQMTCYNAGRDGQSIFYFLAIQKAILKRYIPKIIILDINANELALNPSSYERLNSLLPYCRENIEIEKIVNLRGKYEKYKQLSYIYPYNSMILTITNNLIFPKVESNSGYKPLNKRMGEIVVDSVPSNNLDIDVQKEKAFIEFIKNCKENDIDLFIVRSPYYSINSIQNKSLTEILNISNKMNVKLLDYANVDSLTKYSNYNVGEIMADPGHLNYIGAEYFTKLVGERIYNNIIKSEPQNN